MVSRSLRRSPREIPRSCHLLAMPTTADLTSRISPTPARRTHRVAMLLTTWLDLPHWSLELGNILILSQYHDDENQYLIPSNFLNTEIPWWSGQYLLSSQISYIIWDVFTQGVSDLLGSASFCTSIVLFLEYRDTIPHNYLVMVKSEYHSRLLITSWSLLVFPVSSLEGKST